jgi:YD repeat-containing protein
MKQANRASATLIMLVSFALPISAVDATETVTYKYDALGRLVQTTKSGGPANGQQTKTKYDPAGNRTCHSTTGVGGVPGTSCPP